MLDNQSITERLESLVPGVSVMNIQTLDGGISASSWLAEVNLNGETLKWVVRLPGDYRYSERTNPSEREFQVLSSLQKTLGKVQMPVAVEPDESPENRKFFVMEFVEGSPFLDPADLEGFLHQYAIALARVHQTPFPGVELEIVDLGWDPKYAALNADLHEGLIRQVLSEYKRSHANPKTLCHGDPWPGNIIWKDGKLQCFIDWEETRISDPLFDVAICRLELIWLLGVDAMHDWTAKFQAENGISLEDLAYWDLVAALRPIRWVEHWAPAFAKLGRPDVTAETMTTGLKWFIEDALERATGSKP